MSQTQSDLIFLIVFLFVGVCLMILGVWLFRIFLVSKKAAQLHEPLSDGILFGLLLYCAGLILSNLHQLIRDFVQVTEINPLQQFWELSTFSGKIIGIDLVFLALLIVISRFITDQFIISRLPKIEGDRTSVMARVIIFGSTALFLTLLTKESLLVFLNNFIPFPELPGFN